MIGNVESDGRDSINCLIFNSYKHIEISIDFQFVVVNWKIGTCSNGQICSMFNMCSSIQQTKKKKKISGKLAPKRSIILLTFTKKLAKQSIELRLFYVDMFFVCCFFYFLLQRVQSMLRAESKTTLWIFLLLLNCDFHIIFIVVTISQK